MDNEVRLIRLIRFKWAILCVLLIPLIIRSLLQFIGASVSYINPQVNFVLWIIGVNSLLFVTSKIHFFVRVIGSGPNIYEEHFDVDIMQILLLFMFVNILFLITNLSSNIIHLLAPYRQLQSISLICLIIVFIFFQVYLLSYFKSNTIRAFKTFKRSLVSNGKFKFGINMLDLDRFAEFEFISLK